jgi:hypothetical protein
VLTRKITIPAGKVGSDLTGFPFVLNGTFSFLKTEANGGNVKNANGYDIWFSSDVAGTTILPFERAYWDATTGKSEFWVKIDIASASATVFYLQYSDASKTTDQSARTTVWSTNYSVVHHMGAAGSNYGNSAQSNTNDNALDAKSSADSHPATILSEGGHFTPAFAAHQAPYNVGMPATGGPVSISIWFKNDNTTPANYVLYSIGSSCTRGSFRIIQDMTPSIYCFDNDSWSSYILTGFTPSTAWHLVHFVFPSSGWENAKMFYDGVKITSPTIAGSGALNILGSGPWSTLAMRTNNFDFQYLGTLDEARFAKVELSDAWCKAEYDNQYNDNALGFYTIEIPGVPGGGLLLNTNFRGGF